MVSPEQESTDAGARSAERVEALSEFLLDRETLIPVVASQLSGDTSFESMIRGSSMAPAIPKLSRLYVQLLGCRAPGPGDVLYYHVDVGFVVHRLVHTISASSGEKYYLTIGDNCLAPDPPIAENKILGIVVAIETATGRRAIEPSRPRTALHRLARATSISSARFASRFGISAVSRVSAAFRWIEDIARARAGRLLRFFGMLGNR